MKTAPKTLTITLASLALAGEAAAEDLLKPVIDAFFDAIKGLWGMISGFFYAIFPGLENSFAADPFGPLTELLPWISSFAWLFYLAVFLVVMAVIAKIWMMGKHFIINTVVGVLLLLVLIHLLGVEMQITLLKLIITAVFGVPGVLFILLLHYLGIPL